MSRTTNGKTLADAVAAICEEVGLPGQEIPYDEVTHMRLRRFLVKNTDLEPTPEEKARAEAGLRYWLTKPTIAPEAAYRSFDVGAFPPAYCDVTNVRMPDKQPQNAHECNQASRPADKLDALMRKHWRADAAVGAGCGVAGSTRLAEDVTAELTWRRELLANLVRHLDDSGLWKDCTFLTPSTWSRHLEYRVCQLIGSRVELKANGSPALADQLNAANRRIKSLDDEAQSYADEALMALSRFGVATPEQGFRLDGGASLMGSLIRRQGQLLKHARQQEADHRRLYRSQIGELRSYLEVCGGRIEVSEVLKRLEGL